MICLPCRVVIAFSISIAVWFQPAAMAQVAPFSMAPESTSKEEPNGTGSKPLPGIQYLREPGAATPSRSEPETRDFRTGRSMENKTAAGTFRRYLYPGDQLKLRGETASRSWSFVLTQEQAEAPATLNAAYQNAVLVAPETSQLRISINNETLITEPIASPNGLKQLSVKIPEGLLLPGRNLISVTVEERHRTDCSIESTFDLWTSLAPSRFFLQFPNAADMRLTSIGQLSAIGNNAQGRTPIQIVAPAIDESPVQDTLLRLVQHVALAVNMPNQPVSVVAAPFAGTEPALTVYVGTNEQLSAFSEIRDVMEQTPDSLLVQIPESDTPVLIVSGRSWSEVEDAVNKLATLVALTEADSLEHQLDIHNAYAPNPPMITGGAGYKFSELGYQSQEFSGRRFETEMMFGLPDDFYAAAYGELKVVLNAAFSPDVLPGSTIDILMNDQIAATVPINRHGGLMMDKHPINVPLRHAKPGLNKIAIEANLKTREDQICLAGTTANTTDRFVLFDTSELIFPEFARIGQIPDLAAFGSFGFPYNLKGSELDVVLARQDAASMSAAATLLARMAISAGHPVTANNIGTEEAAADRDVMFIGNIGSLPSPVLNHIGLGNLVNSPWASSEFRQSSAQGAVTDNQKTLESWRDRVSSEGWRGQFRQLLRSFLISFELTQNNLRLMPSSMTPYEAPAGTNIVIAQNAAMSGSGVWTVVTAPDNQNLSTNIDLLLERWSALSGQVSAFQPRQEQLYTRNSESVRFMPTQPWSLTNLRLIAANWVSINTLVFGVAFLLVIVGLGIASTSLLRIFGRQSPK